MFLSPVQFAPTAKESITISASTTALALERTVAVEPLSYPSVSANILRRQLGYLNLNFLSCYTAVVIQSYNLVDPLG